MRIDHRSLADRRDAAARAGDLDWAGPRRYEADADVTGGLVWAAELSKKPGPIQLHEGRSAPSHSPCLFDG